MLSGILWVIGGFLLGFGVCKWASCSANQGTINEMKAKIESLKDEAREYKEAFEKVNIKNAKLKTQIQQTKDERYDAIKDGDTAFSDTPVRASGSVRSGEYYSPSSHRVSAFTQNTSPRTTVVEHHYHNSGNTGSSRSAVGDIATTAAGVVAGEMLYDSIKESGRREAERSHESSHHVYDSSNDDSDSYSGSTSSSHNYDSGSSHSYDSGSSSSYDSGYSSSSSYDSGSSSYDSGSCDCGGGCD